mgnify:CR=1 FL=1
MRRARPTDHHRWASRSDHSVISLFDADTPILIHRHTTGGSQTKPKEYNMKRIALVTALVAASVSGAFAQQAPVQLSSAIHSEILSVLPGADLSALTNSQYAQIVTLFDDTENTNTPAGPPHGVKPIVKNARRRNPHDPD